MVTTVILELAVTSILTGATLGFSFRVGWLIADRLFKTTKKK